LVGFTAFSERRGEEAAYSLMQRVSALMTDVIHGRGGTVKNFTGDGLMVLFGVPAVPPPPAGRERIPARSPLLLAA
jgi:class 3 adenylate cyclase